MQRAHDQPRPHFHSSIIPVLASALLGALFLIAAIGKAIEPWPFLRLLAFLTPDSHRETGLWRWLGGAVIGWEAFLGALLLLQLRRPATRFLTIATLVVFSLTLVWIQYLGDAPACGCLGVLGAAQDASQSPTLGLARNAGMIVLACWLGAASSKHTDAIKLQPRDPAPDVRECGPEQRGFALVELLVCIAIIAILLALVTPSLRKVRASAQLTGSLSMNRQLVACASLYSGDHADGLPFFGVPGQPFGRITVGGKSISWNGFFRDQGSFWLTEIVPAYYSGPRTAIEYLTEDGKPNNQPWGEPVILSPFQLSHTAFARPEFWADRPSAASEHEYDWSLLRGTRHDDVRFPSEKGLIVDVSIGWLRGAGEGPDVGPVMSTGFADGSSAAPVIFASDLDSIVSRPLGAYHFPMFATRDGLGGRDRR